MKKIALGAFILVALFAFCSQVLAKFIVTNEKYMVGYGSSTNTIGGETFPANYSVMSDKRLQSSGDAKVRAVATETLSAFSTIIVYYNFNYAQYSADGRTTTSVVGRQKKPTTLYWMKNDTTSSKLYIVGSYQY